jgi:NDP-sugar pyrophosphorylase family protein
MSVTSAVILIGGPASRGNFLPLDLPGPLLPIAGLEMIIHQIYALTKIPGIKDIHLYGYYENF